MRLLPFAFAGILCSFVACGSSASEKKKPELPEQSNSLTAPGAKNAIVQVRQTLNLTPQNTYQSVITSLQRRSVAISAADENSGTVETDWIPIRDSACGAAHMSGAPLTCRTRMSVKIEPVHRASSALNIRYQEFCSINEEVSVACPGSAAEKLMLSIVEEIRTLDEKLDKGRTTRSITYPTHPVYE